MSFTLGGTRNQQMVSGFFDDRLGVGAIQYQLLAILEEGGEMLGIILLIYAQFCYLEKLSGQRTISILDVERSA